jgi:hypothetical protein
MRVAIVASCIIMCAGGAFAQNPPSGQTGAVSGHSDGRTVLPPEIKDEKNSPNGRNKPADTGSGGAPAESPQGQTPPAMQAAPEGSSKTIIDPK